MVDDVANLLHGAPPLRLAIILLLAAKLQQKQAKQLIGHESCDLFEVRGERNSSSEGMQ
jgi:hypothetical protein